MRRAFLLTVTVLGILVCLIGSTGLFAALSDTASTGTNTVTSDGLAPSADIRLATATDPGFVCGSFADDLTTPMITATEVVPGTYTSAAVCLTNVGSQALATLQVVVDELSDVDDACTGDESDSGDASCGAEGAGELSGVIDVRFAAYSCADSSVLGISATESLLESSSVPISLLVPGIGETICYRAEITYPESTSAGEVQQAQSDTATWRFKFIART